jgi:hypothetical protein
MADDVTDLFTEIRVESWNELKHYSECRNKNATAEEKWNRWIFRGHKCSEWRLSTALERTLCDRFRMGLTEASLWERRLSREFKRKGRGLVSNPPQDIDHMEWLALMQHYGAPTRLQDWTYSFWTAVFYALEDANINAEKSCAVWALQIDWWRDRVAGKIPELNTLLAEGSNQKGEVQYILNSAPGSMCGIWPLNAYWLNERVVAQQSLFIVPLDITRSFRDNLIACPERQDRTFQRLIKFIIPFNEEIIRESTKYLYDHNLTSATLFPGIAGFARSIGNLSLLPDRFLGVGDRSSRPWPE